MENIIARIGKVPLPQRIAVMLVILVAIVASTYFMAVVPLEEKIVVHDRAIANLDTELVKKKAIARDLTRYRVEVERLKQRLNEALTLLPNDAEIPELLQKLASLVQQSDLVMEQFEPQAEESAGFYAKIPVRMSITGNYHSIAVFFDKVAKLARIVNVSDISLKEPKVENKRIILRAEFNATTFKFIDQGGAVATDASSDVAPVIQ